MKQPTATATTAGIILLIPRTTTESSKLSATASPDFDTCSCSQIQIQPSKQSRAPCLLTPHLLRLTVRHLGNTAPYWDAISQTPSRPFHKENLPDSLLIFYPGN